MTLSLRAAPATPSGWRTPSSASWRMERAIVVSAYTHKPHTNLSRHPGVHRTVIFVLSCTGLSGQRPGRHHHINLCIFCLFSNFIWKMMSVKNKCQSEIRVHAFSPLPPRMECALCRPYCVSGQCPHPLGQLDLLLLL